MKKLTVIIALILLMSISACSFFPDGAINNVEDKDDNNSASIYIEDNRAVGIISDNMEVDGKYAADLDGSWYVCKTNRRGPDKEEADRNAELLKKEGTAIVDCKEIRDKNNNLLRYIYEYSDGSRCISDSKIMYGSETYSQFSYGNYFPTKYGIKKKEVEVFTADELNGLSKEECIIKVENVLNKLGIDICDNPIVYTIDVNTQKAIKENNALYANMKDLTENDECYCMVFERKFENQPMSDVAYDDSSYAGIPIEVQVIYGRQGLIYLNTSDRYDIVEKEEVTDGIISVNEALDIIKSVKQYISDQKIIEIRLQYIPQVTQGNGADYNTIYEIAPYWVMVIERPASMSDGEYKTRNDIVFINAFDKRIYLKSCQGIISF